MQTLLYSAIGACMFCAAWVVPGRLIRPVPPRVVCQLLAVVATAFLLPTPNDSRDAFFAGQYAFAGGIVLVGAFHVAEKVISRLVRASRDA